MSINRLKDGENVVHLHIKFYLVLKENEFMKCADKCLKLEHILT